MSVFFLSNPTLVIAPGLSYCIGEFFGTQLQPNPATGQPIETGPYPPFPPASSPALTTFTIQSASAAGDEGYGDATITGGPFGTLVSGGGTGGATLNGFYVTPGGGAVNLEWNLKVTSTSTPAQNFFNSLSFTDANANTWDLLSAGVGSTGPFVLLSHAFSPTGDSAIWTWIFNHKGGTYLTDGTDYPITVS
jgi:hypothetical protein